MSRPVNDKIKTAIDNEILEKIADGAGESRDAWRSNDSKECSKHLKESKKNLNDAVKKIDEITKVLDDEG